MKKIKRTELGPSVNSDRKVPKAIRALFPEGADITVDGNTKRWKAVWWEIEESPVEVNVSPAPSTPLTPEEIEVVNFGDLAKAHQVKEIAHSVSNLEMFQQVLEANVSGQATKQKQLHDGVAGVTNRLDEMEVTMAKLNDSNRTVGDVQLAMKALQDEMGKLTYAHKAVDEMANVEDKVNALVVRNGELETSLIKLRDENSRLDKKIYELTGHLAMLADAVFHIGNNKKKKEYAAEAYEITKIRPDLFEGDDE